jgi:two-component SAPR family response regulator
VVFVTAYDEYAVQAFEHNAVDYVLKPVSRERLGKTVDRIRKALASPADDTRLLAALQKLLPAVVAGAGSGASGGARQQ